MYFGDSWFSVWLVVIVIPWQVLDDMYELAIATTMFTSMLESAAAEQSSRMNAMENASKNGEDLIKELSIQYNRARQARITTELVEIISGASALESK